MTKITEKQFRELEELMNIVYYPPQYSGYEDIVQSYVLRKLTKLPAIDDYEREHDTIVYTHSIDDLKDIPQELFEEVRDEIKDIMEENICSECERFKDV